MYIGVYSYSYRCIFLFLFLIGLQGIFQIYIFLKRNPLPHNWMLSHRSYMSIFCIPKRSYGGDLIHNSSHTYSPVHLIPRNHFFFCICVLWYISFLFWSNRLLLKKEELSHEKWQVAPCLEPWHISTYALLFSTLDFTHISADSFLTGLALLVHTDEVAGQNLYKIELHCAFSMVQLSEYMINVESLNKRLYASCFLKL